MDFSRLEKSGQLHTDEGISVARTTVGMSDTVRLGYDALREHSFTLGDSWQSAEPKSHHEEAVKYKAQQTRRLEEKKGEPCSQKRQEREVSAGIRQTRETGGGLGGHCSPRGLLSWSPLVTGSTMSGAMDAAVPAEVQGVSILLLGGVVLLKRKIHQLPLHMQKPE